MKNQTSRRDFVKGAALAGVAIISGSTADPMQAGASLPLVDYHVHLDSVVTLEKALERSKALGVKFGIVEHAGTKANPYPGLLSTDQDLRQYLEKLSGKPVLKGIQAEGVDWMTCFSKELVIQLDYVLTDALTFPEKNGERVRLWNPSVRIEDKQDFMDRYVAFHVEIMAKQPIDILANPTFLPSSIEKDYDTLWTSERMKKIIDAAVKYRVAIEINSRYSLPRIAFLRLAKKAGAKFSFGSNIHGLDVGKLDYCIQMAKELGLQDGDLFVPAPRGKKPIEVRKA